MGREGYLNEIFTDLIILLVKPELDFELFFGAGEKLWPWQVEIHCAGPLGVLPAIPQYQAPRRSFSAPRSCKPQRQKL